MKESNNYFKGSISSGETNHYSEGLLVVKKGNKISFFKQSKPADTAILH